MRKGLIKGQLSQNNPDILNQLNSINTTFKSSDPRFNKYLEKAMQFAQPADVPEGKQVFDQSGLAKYKLLIDGIKNLAKITNAANEVRIKLHENQLKIFNLFQKIKIVSEELARFTNQQSGTMLLNEDSKELLEKLESFYDEMQTLSQKSQEIVEDGFDKVNGIRF